MSEKEKKPALSKAKQEFKARKANSKEPLWLEEYRDCFNFTWKPVTEMFIERFFGDLVQTINMDEDILMLEEVYLKKGVPHHAFYRWVEKFPVAKEAHTTAKRLLAVRREKGALKRQYDSNMVLKSLAMYNDDWKNIEEWRAGLREKEEAGKGNITVVLDSIPSSPAVPPKKSQPKLTPEEVMKTLNKKARRQNASRN